MTPNLQSILTVLSQLTPDERAEIKKALTTTQLPTLTKPIDGLSDWINELRLRGCAQGTIDMYSRTAKKLLEQDPIPTAGSIRSNLAERLKVVTPTKVRNDQKALKSFFGFLEEQKLWPDNPTKGMKLIKVRKVVRQAPDKEDVLKLLTAWDDPNPRIANKRIKHRALLMLLVDTGLRISEACSIKKDNVRLDELYIKVEGKGNKERIVPISPQTRDIIGRYIYRTLHKKGGYLFPANNEGGYQGIRTLERTFRRLCRRLDIKPITPHMLRHYFATHALKNGAKLEVISKILGHASVGITADVYRTIEQAEIQSEHLRFSPLAANGILSA
jgi:integrase/recombinase XerD